MLYIKDAIVFHKKSLERSISGSYAALKKYNNQTRFEKYLESVGFGYLKLCDQDLKIQDFCFYRAIFSDEQKANDFDHDHFGPYYSYKPDFTADYHQFTQDNHKKSLAQDDFFIFQTNAINARFPKTGSIDVCDYDLRTKMDAAHFGTVYNYQFMTVQQNACATETLLRHTSAVFIFLVAGFGLIYMNDVIALKAAIVFDIEGIGPFFSPEHIIYALLLIVLLVQMGCHFLITRFYALARFFGAKERFFSTSKHSMDVLYKNLTLSHIGRANLSNEINKELAGLKDNESHLSHSQAAKEVPCWAKLAHFNEAVEKSNLDYLDLNRRRSFLMLDAIDARTDENNSALFTSFFLGSLVTIGIIGLFYQFYQHIDREGATRFLLFSLTTMIVFWHTINVLYKKLQAQRTSKLIDEIMDVTSQPYQKNLERAPVAFDLGRLVAHLFTVLKREEKKRR